MPKMIDELLARGWEPDTHHELQPGVGILYQRGRVGKCLEVYKPPTYYRDQGRMVYAQWDTADGTLRSLVREEYVSGVPE